MIIKKMMAQSATNFSTKNSTTSDSEPNIPSVSSERKTVRLSKAPSSQV